MLWIVVKCFRIRLAVSLANIIAKHGKELDIKTLQNVLSDMSRVPTRRSDRIDLESKKYHATVRLTWDHTAKKWLLPAFDRTVPGNKKLRPADERSSTVSTPIERGEAHSPERSSIPSIAPEEGGVKLPKGPASLKSCVIRDPRAKLEDQIRSAKMLEEGAKTRQSTPVVAFCM
jgi:hypothetical protein